MNEKVKQKLSRRTLVLIKLICVLFVLFLVVDSAQSLRTNKRTTTRKSVLAKWTRDVRRKTTTPVVPQIKTVTKRNALKNKNKKPIKIGVKRDPNKDDKKKTNVGFLSEISEDTAIPLLSLGKVINFFPVGDERECAPRRGSSVAAAGICLNPYDCRQRDGRAAGDCAYGLGVCCVFEVTCGATIRQNVTYFMSPRFPEVWPGEAECNVTLHKVHEGITQLRIDFIHFNIGQPNRNTGECDSDVLNLDVQGRNMKLCGQNHGQHMYYDLPTAGSSRDEDGDLTSGATTLHIRAPLPGTARVWLLKLQQLALAQAAPHDCMQYFTTDNGTITTFNYASNGRHLADMTYRSCVRRNAGKCAVQYAPCHPTAFRIGKPSGLPAVLDPAAIYSGSGGPGSNGGAGTGFYGPQGAFVTIAPPQNTTGETDSSDQAAIVDDPVADAPEDPVEDQADNGSEVEGSGDDPMIPDMNDMMTDDMQSQMMFEPPERRTGREWKRWSPYAQHYIKREGNRKPHYYYGYGNFGVGLFGFGRQRCGDRVTVPCDNDNFIVGGLYGPGVCDPHHCGSSFCPDTAPEECRVETTSTPFAVKFNFGPPVNKGLAEDNIGACLKFQQLPCDA